jgi:hypothetical protein
MATRDVATVKAKRDKIAFVEATRAQAADNYRRAAEAMAKGDFGNATRTIQGNTALLNEAADVGGAQAVEGDRKLNDSLFGLSTAAPTAAPEEQQRQVKSLKRQYFLGSGRGASVY